MQRDVDDFRHVAREQGDGHGDVEQDIRQRRYMRDGEGAQQQVDRYSDEEIRQFIGVLVPTGNRKTGPGWLPYSALLAA